MHLKKIIFCVVIASAFFAFADENEFFTEEDIPAAESLNDFSGKNFSVLDFIETLLPAKISEKGSKNSVLIRTNVRDVKVFLNGVYKGLSPVSISNLEPGTYILRLEKTGYLPVTKYISVSKGTSYNYYYEMTEIKGFVEIRGIPDAENCQIFADGNRFYEPFFELPEGYHRILVRNFGYEDFSATVYVKRHRIKRISIKMKEAEFKVTDFYSSRKTINPEYSGALGNCSLTAKVSTKGTGFLSIKDALGNEVFSYSFKEFSTWEQTINWNGKDSAGNELPSGTYTATFSAERQNASLEIEIDRTMIFPLNDLTFSGTGIGSVATASILPKGTNLFTFSVAPVAGSDNGFYASPVLLGFATSALKQLELSIKAGILAGITDSPIQFSLAMKFAEKTKNENSPVQFQYGTSVRYGFCETKLFPDYGSDFGAGLGLSGFIGICNAKFSADFSSEFIFGAKTSNPFNGDNSWKNGLAFSFSPVPEFSANISCALISNANYFDALQPKAGFSYLIPGTSFVLSADFYGIIYFDSPYYLGGSAGFGYLF